MEEDERQWLEGYTKNSTSNQNFEKRQSLDEDIKELKAAIAKIKGKETTKALLIEYIITVVRFVEKLIEEGAEEFPICGICGGKMIEGYKCKTCEYFFGKSSEIKICPRCKREYGHYPEIENRLYRKFLMAGEDGRAFNDPFLLKISDGLFLCPKCREEFMRHSTLAEKVKDELKQGNFTSDELKSQINDFAPKAEKFIDYCEIPLNTHRSSHKHGKNCFCKKAPGGTYCYNPLSLPG